MNARQSAVVSLTSAALFAAGSANAVTIVDTFAGPNAGPAAGGAPSDLGGVFGYELDLTADFSAAGTSKLVMVYSSKDESGNATANEDFGGAPVTRVTYDGIALEEAIFDADEDGFARVTVGIYYLDNPASDGLLRIELADQFQTEYGLGLYAVNGLAPGVTDTATASGSGDLVPAVAVTVNTPTGFVVQEAARNNQTLTPSDTDDWVTLYNYPGPQSYRGLSQYLIADAPGNYSAPINNTGVFKRISTASFNAIPEPASIAVLGLGGLLIAGRRRRS